MKSVFSMQRNGKVRSYLINADGSAIDAVSKEKYADFADLFILLRMAGYEPAGELQIATPAHVKRERVTLRKAKSTDRRCLRQCDGFRRQWAEYEVVYEDNFSMD